MDETKLGHPDAPPGEGVYDSEIDVRAIVRFGVILALVIAVVLAGTWFLMVAFKARSVARDPAPSPLPEARIPRLPPEPRLQSFPRQDLRQMREAENAVLTGYGWVDRAGGIARIPVDRAVAILLDKGLPPIVAKPPAAAPAAQGGPPAPARGAQGARPAPATGAPRAPSSRSTVPPRPGKPGGSRTIPGAHGAGPAPAAGTPRASSSRGIVPRPGKRGRSGSVTREESSTVFGNAAPGAAR